MESDIESATDTVKKTPSRKTPSKKTPASQNVRFKYCMIFHIVMVFSFDAASDFDSYFL